MPFRLPADKGEHAIARYTNTQILQRLPLSVQVDYVSPQGGYTPVDPASLEGGDETDWEWYQNKLFMNRLGTTLKPSDVTPSDYSSIYFAGASSSAPHLRCALKLAGRRALKSPPSMLPVTQPQDDCKDKLSISLLSLRLHLGLSPCGRVARYMGVSHADQPLTVASPSLILEWEHGSMEARRRRSSDWMAFWRRNAYRSAGGHGTVYDFVDCTELHSIAAQIYEAGGVVSSVCHGAVALLKLKLSSGSLLIQGKKVTGRLGY